MASRLKIPKLGMSMNEGAIVEWLVADGDEVNVGQPLYILETEKTQTEVPSPVAGKIRLIGELETSYEIGTVIAEVV
jgi:pyruvate/2-oxoglutarate dehydrogenase complex dihydrolipoamide acyltransferase (E2) component